MSIELNVDVKANEEKINEVKKQLSGIFTEAANNAKTSTVEMGDNVDKAIQGIMTAWDKTITAGFAGTKKSLDGAISDSIAPLFQGEMDKVEKIWDTAWSSMQKSLSGIFTGMLKDLTSGITSFLGNVANDIVLTPVKDWFVDLTGMGSLIKDPAGTIKGLLGLGTSSGAGAATNSAWFSSLSSIFDTSAAPALAPEDAWLSSLSSIFDTSAAPTLTPNDAWLSSLSSIFDTSAAPAFQAGATTGESFVSGLQSSLAANSGMLAVGGGLLAFDLLTRAMGAEGGVVEGLSNTLGAAFGLTELGGHTKQSAREYIQADMDFMGRVGEDSSGFTLDNVQSEATEIAALADRAGYSQEDIDAMVDSLGTYKASLVEAAQLNAQLGEGINTLIADFASQSESSTQSAESLHNLQAGMEGIAGVISSVSGGAVDLSGEFQNLFNSFVNGDITSQELADKLRSETSAALETAAKEGSLTADQMRALADAISGIPTEWNSTVTVTRIEEVIHRDTYESAGEHHAGGLIFHRGGLVPAASAGGGGGGGGGLGWYLRAARRYHAGARVSSLAADEVPIIAQQGEFVVRKASVDAATLPLLQAINAGQGGTTRAGAQAASIAIQNLVNIEGHFYGDRESREDLVRQIESRLRELSGARYVA